jgi:hypothetical protein
MDPYRRPNSIEKNLVWSRGAWKQIDGCYFRVVTVMLQVIVAMTRRVVVDNRVCEGLQNLFLEEV